MRTGKRGIDLIKKWEGNGEKGKPYVAYICQAGKPTIGYGHTKNVTFQDVKNQKKITPEYAEKLLADDLSEAERAVNNLVKVNLGQNQFDALVSFTFNLGSGALSQSTLLKMINEGRLGEAAGQFSRWVYTTVTKPNGEKVKEISKGLVSRREDERKLYLMEDI